MEQVYLLNETLTANTYHLEKHFSDNFMIQNNGNFFDYDNTWTFINNSAIIYHNNKLLAKIIKNAIPSHLSDLAYNNFIDTSKIITSNRGSAAGQQSRINKNKYEQGIPVHSAIVGYINSTNHKKPCRLTEYTKNNIEKFENAYDFINAVNQLFKMNVPDKYQSQYNKSIETDFHIKDTAFSTITVNYNFRTALHKDSGDYQNGFGNIVVINKNILGGHLLLPQYKLAIQIDNGDYCTFNVHEWHCNSLIHYNSELSKNDSYRMSFIFYLRDKLEKCKQINNNLEKILGNLNGKQWNTNIIFKDIFKDSEKLPDIVYITPKWWQMKSDKYLLEYKNKRYKLYDCKKNIFIHNLMNAWEYVSSN